MGKLILLTLPIGNMEDLSPRCANALKNGKHFFVEDTRVFKDRVNRAGIELGYTTLCSFHDQDRSQLDRALELIRNGEDVYLASDAGSPIISDPAYPMVKAILDEGLELESLPGPNSVTTALELSGLPPHPYHFHGFLPKEKEKKRNEFSYSSSIEGTHIYFESPHRVLETVDILVDELRDLDICLAKELTKIYQSVHRFSSRDWSKERGNVIDKGEFVLLFHSKGGAHKSDNKLVKLAEDVLVKPNNKKLSKLLSEILGEKAKDIYKKLEGSRENTD